MLKIIAGGIYLVAAPTNIAERAALVLVTAVGDIANLVSVTLLSPDCQLGTSEDLRLEPARGKLPYPLLVQADIFGYIRHDQFVRHLATVAPAVMAALDRLRNDDVVNMTLAGPPAVQRQDPRWQFKLAELRRMQKITVLPYL